MGDRENIELVHTKIQEIYSIVNELEAAFPGRKFTPDGHLVGSIGEVLATYHYGVELLQASTETHDALSKDGKLIQIKATQGKSIGIRSEPEHLIVLKILNTGNAIEVYNGPGKIAWEVAGKIQKNGQRSLSINKLKELMGKIQVNERLPIANNFR